MGLVLQDLTFVHIGNSDYVKDKVNFAKRWQQYNILVRGGTSICVKKTVLMYENISILRTTCVASSACSIRTRGGRTSFAASATLTTRSARTSSGSCRRRSGRGRGHPRPNSQTTTDGQLGGNQNGSWLGLGNGVGKTHRAGQ